MPRFMKAYPLKQLRCFPGWTEPSGEGERPGDEEVVYLDEDLRVTGGIFEDDVVLFSGAVPEWRRFCEETLGFQVPDWEAESERVREQLRDLRPDDDDAPGHA